MKFLIGTDGSEGAKTIFPFIKRLGIAEAEARVVSAVDFDPAFARKDPDAIDAARESITAYAEHDLQVAEQQLPPGWEKGGEIRQGPVVEELLAVARGFQPDVLVVGTKGASGIGSFLLGSTAEALIGCDDYPVLVVRERSKAAEVRQQPLRFIVGMDLSDASEAVAVECQDLAKLCAKPHVRLVSVMESVKKYRLDILKKMSSQWEAERKALVSRQQELADRFQEVCGKVETEVREGDVASELIAAAEQYSADILFIGHKARSFWGDLTRGSAVSKVARHAPCSVWVGRSVAERD